MPYKITRSESYKADQTKSGDSLKHYGVKGMKWGKEIFGKDDIPGQSGRGGGSSSPGPAPSKALSSALNSRVSVGSAKPAMAKSQAQVLSEYYGKGRKMGPEDIGKVKPLFTNNANIKGATIDAANRAYELKKKYTGPNPAEVLANKRLADSKKAKATASKKQQEPVKDTRSGLQKWFDQAGKDIGNTFNSAKKGVEDAASSVKKWGEGAVNDTKKWVEGAANDTKKWADNAIKDIGKTAVKIGDDAKKAYGDAEKWVNGAIKDVGNAAVKVGDDAKKAYGDAKTFVDSLLRGEKAVDYVDGNTGKVVKGEGYLPGKIEKAFNSAKDSVHRTTADVGNAAAKAYGDAKKWVDTAIGDAKKWTDQAGKDVGKTASDLADELVYGTKYAVGTARTAVKNAANKVKDTYERITDTGTQRLLNPKHMTSRQKQAIWSKKATKQGVEKNLEEGLGPMVNSYDAFKAIDKKTGGKGYDVVARSGKIDRDLTKKSFKSNTPNPRELVNKKSPTVKLLGPSMADATKYLSPSDLSAYKRSLDYVKRYGRGDGSVERELDGYVNKVAWEKSRERNK